MKLPDLYSWVCDCGRKMPAHLKVCGECGGTDPKGS